MSTEVPEELLSIAGLLMNSLLLTGTHPEGTCAQPLYPDSLNFLQLNDSCSGATFSLYDGSPINGSEYGLRQYQTVYGGANLLRIYN
jgi:hypothetical protein